MPSKIMKISLISISLFVVAGFSHPAQAGRHYDRYYHGGYGHYDRHHYRGHRYKRHHRRHRSSDRAAYLVGGLVLGSLITNAYHRSNEPYVERRVSYYEPRRIRSSSRVTRRLFRDRDGNCFERNYNRQGDEIMIELDPAQCAW